MVGVKNWVYWERAEGGEVDVRVERWVHIDSRVCEFWDAIFEEIEGCFRSRS